MRLGSLQLPVESFSASSLTKAIQCPEAWRHRYLLKEKETFGVEKFVGTVDHRVWEGFFEERLRDGEPWERETLHSVYEYTWKDELQRIEDHTDQQVVWGSDSPDKLRERGKMMVDAYYDTVALTINPVAVEQRFEETIPGVDVPIVGYVDLETPHVLIERKTSKTKVSKPKPTWRFQARIYQLIHRKPVEWHVITKQATPQIVTGQMEDGLILPVTSADTTVWMIQGVVSGLNDLYLRYGPDSPWPTTGFFHDWACSYCSFVNKCPAWVKQ